MVYNILKVINDDDLNYNLLITLICDSIILAKDCEEAVCNHYFKQGDNDFANLMFRLLINKKTSKGNVRRIRIVLRIITERCNRIEIDFNKS